MSIEPRDDFEGAAASQQLVDDLTVARDLVKRGWCRGLAHRRTWLLRRNQYCLTGAIAEACFQDGVPEGGDRPFNCIDAIYAVLFGGMISASNMRTVQHWNDQPHRRKLDVIRAFNHAIGRAEAQL